MKGLKTIGRKIAAMILSACMIASPISSALTSITRPNVVMAADSNSRIRKSSRTVKGVKYSLTIDLKAEDGSMSEAQIKNITDLFYEVYPQLYDRFGAYNNAPTDVTFCFETNYTHEGISRVVDGIIYVNGKYFADKKDHYDLLTHELGHTVMNIWYTQNMEEGALENFADYCRYVYSYQNGKYNDSEWLLRDTYYDREHGRKNSVRFLVWLDYVTNSSDKDILRDYYEICEDGKYPRGEWAAKVWPKLFKNTQFKNKSIDEVWQIYLYSDFSHYDSQSKNGNPSEIIRRTEKEKGISIRELLKKHSFSQSYEDSLNKQK